MSTSVNWVPRRQDIDENSFLDITLSVVTSLAWEQDGSATVVFEDDLTELQIIDVKFWMGSRDDIEGLLFGQGLEAITANLVYTGAPENWEANLITQVVAISNQMNIAFRLLMGELAVLTPPV